MKTTDRSALAFAMKTTGSAAFYVDGELHRFRFIVSVRSEALAIWLEDCRSKEQWLVSKMITKDFVKDGSAIPNATLVDYARHFAEQLQATEAEGGERNDSKGKCTLFRQTDDLSLKIQFELVLQTTQFLTTLLYEFRLAAVPSDKVEILDAKFRDLEGEMLVLKEAKGLEATVAPKLAYGLFRSTGPVEFNSPLVWETHPSAEVIGLEFMAEKEGILVKQRGLYLIDVDVGFPGKQSFDGQFLLQVNGKTIRMSTCYTRYSDVRWQSTSIVRPLQANDTVMVVNRGAKATVEDCTISVAQLR